MNRIMKFATTTAMTATLLLGGSSVFADVEVSNGPSLTPSITVQNEDETTPIFKPFDTRNPIFNTQLRDGVKPSFKIDPGYGWVKVWVQNDTNSEMTVRVTQGSLTGAEKMLFKVPANSQLGTLGTAGWSTGDFYVAISTKDSSPLKGLLAVKLATTKDEL
jgi:hypothetical protein